MARIKVLGATGHGGSAIVKEAARRGHEVTGYSRHAPAAPVEGVSYVIGSVLEPEILAATVAETDAVFGALSPRGDMLGALEGVLDELIGLADAAGVRLGWLGGASSLLVSEGGPRLLDVHTPPAEVLPEVLTGISALETLRAAPDSLDWFYVSPPAEFGAWFPEIVTGEYRLSDDVLLKDAEGRSYISAADLAVAVVDEIENPTHQRARFHVAH